MAKYFFDAFPQVKLDPALYDLAERIEVTKVTTNKNRSELRVSLSCDDLLQKETVHKLEREIQKQVFPGEDVSVLISETFSLSGRYALSELIDAYWNSVLEEFRGYSLLEYNLLCHAKALCPDEDTLRVTLEDSFVAHQKEQDIRCILEKILRERCGMQAAVELCFSASDVSRKTSDAQLQLQREAQEIAAARSAAAASAGDRARSAAKNAPQPRAEKRPAGNPTSKPRTRSSHPDVIWGRDFDETPIPIEQIVEEMGEVVVRGQVIRVDEHEIRGDKTIVTFVLTDQTDSIAAKMFCANDKLPDIKERVCVGAFLMVRGLTAIDRYDRELMIGSITGIRAIPSFFAERNDTSPVKRVELHCHTKMSDMDGVSDVQDLIRRAKSWGHRAIAITDHGVVQAFTDAARALEPDDDFRIIYGMEAYLVDDQKSPVTHPAGQDFRGSFVVFDLETTGLSSEKNQIIEIGAVRVEDGKIADTFSSFVNPKVPIPYHIRELTGISDDLVVDASPIGEVLPQFLAFSDGAVMVAHNADFDMGFIKKNTLDCGLSCPETYLDTEELAKLLMPELKRFSLDNIAKTLHIKLEHHHRAVDDAMSTALIFLHFIDLLAECNISTLEELNKMKLPAEEAVKKHSYRHAVLLAKNDIGRVNLFKLVSDAHIKYFYRRPLIPKSLLLSHREGILIGSACEAGELYQALENGRSEEEIYDIASFYDYFEVMPVANNEYLIKSERSPVESVEDLREINRRIVALGEETGKPVAATGDVHYLDPQDAIYRQIILYGKHFKDADAPSPLYLRTTQEMLDEFAYLGREKAEEIVITNPNRIVDMCEPIQAVRPDTCPPEIENADQLLRDICYRRAHEIYGETLPVIVSERLERELGSIISNGFAVLYIIAQKLVWKSNEDGYLVGSRGSVGSSLVATMAGITEVNPLRPHYICPNCHYTDFDSPEVRAFAGRAGCDMPDKNCPVCGGKLSKEGFDIPFETFLGFEGNKEPDIDLNFSGDYQSKAHKYAEVIFGDGQTYRAGTIGTMAEKTAFGFVKNYYEEHEIEKRSCEIDRIVQGCVGVRRTTGQHPGGIIVLPIGEEINTFTPVQHPANDMSSGIVTTHFDYHSIAHNLLKIDILGHDDPTMIRMLQDLTGMDPRQIPLDCPEVMSLFQDTSALGVSPEDIYGCPLGSLGIPEFGTEFAMQMLLDTHPTQFSDLVRIAGLSHGTDVWLGNAQTLLKEGRATISTAICTRDDIMTYLISKGLEPRLAFTIMERVRKGDIAKGKCADWPQWKQEMLDHGVPDWYPASCEKIRYMFPKAHAAAYVMMAWRIAYCKVFYPLAYYAAYFSVRAAAFDYEIMCLGREHLEQNMDDYLRRKDALSPKESETLKVMRVVQEMYARGIEFLPLDIYRAQAHNFQIMDGKLMPAIDTIEEIGDKAAETVEDAARNGTFLSRDDFHERTKVSKPVVERMGRLGMLDGLPETNQLTLFDF